MQVRPVAIGVYRERKNPLEPSTPHGLNRKNTSDDDEI